MLLGRHFLAFAFCRGVNSSLQFAGTVWHLSISCRKLRQAFDTCQFVATNCAKLLTLVNSSPQIAPSFWHLSIRCRKLRQTFDTCQFVAANCGKLLTLVNSSPQIAASFWHLSIRRSKLRQAFDTFFSLEWPQRGQITQRRGLPLRMKNISNESAPVKVA